MITATTWIGLVLFLLLGQAGTLLHTEVLVWVAAVVYTIGLLPLFNQLLTLWSNDAIMFTSTERGKQHD